MAPRVFPAELHPPRPAPVTLRGRDPGVLLFHFQNFSIHIQTPRALRLKLMTAVMADPEVSGRGFLAFAAEPADQTEPALEDHGTAAAFAYGIVFSLRLCLADDLASVTMTFRTFHIFSSPMCFDIYYCVLLPPLYSLSPCCFSVALQNNKRYVTFVEAKKDALYS